VLSVGHVAMEQKKTSFLMYLTYDWKYLLVTKLKVFFWDVFMGRKDIFLFFLLAVFSLSIPMDVNK
jgi:K+-sensing histidine kinase KdpD